MSAFHWFLPTGGDDRTLHPGGHGGGIGADGSAAPAGRPATLAYLTRIAQAADDLGFDGVLTPTGAHCQDAWLTTAALIAATRRLRFLVALRPGLVAPVLAAQMAGTFQRLSGGRLMLNVVAGSSAAEQRGYGDFLDHDQRYARAAEFLDVVRAAARGVPFDHAGEHYTVDGGALREPVDPFPPVYLGGSSEAAIEVAARHADAYLTWGEPVEAVATKIERVRQATDAGRKLRFGLRVHVITRDDSGRAWADAERLIAGLDPATVRLRQQQLSTLDSEGQRRMLALHGGDPARLIVGPNLWAGIGLIRGGAGTALVGGHDEVAARLREYQQAGIDEFILSGYPHLEEAYAFAEGVLPLLR
ncbi:LLM class flavin-dependent oxidoreductase [Hamadaea tsunoensis]|uniref:LLM class flavin-dependent oxidoreductase n=1 Tax=Hamadaea tsunoensis TaxID=53368 RepID=UPI00041DBA6E|nr:LLM class flavin-dependent oxidoreductase [Hamadaea tsunoensis]